jgi:hypothetical protein
VDKIVLSRLIDIATDAPLDSGILLERLIAQNPASFNFHVPLAGGSAGASPELLLRKEGEQFSSCRWPGRRDVSRMTCWIAKRATDCWPRKKTAMNMNWSPRR